MLVLVATVLALLSPVFFGGRMSRLALVRFRGWWILLVALVSQIIIIEVVPDANESLLEAVHLATYVAAGVFVLLNWRIPGLIIIAMGGFLNGATIALNGGTLPASRPAMVMAGIDVKAQEFKNSGLLTDPVLPWLGDIFVWPTPMPFANVYSIGDMLIVLGALYGAHKITGSRIVRKPWNPPELVGAVESSAPEPATARQPPVGGDAGPERGVRPSGLAPLTGEPG
jgi:hypothetical protein